MRDFLKRLFCKHDWKRQHNFLLEQLHIVNFICTKCGKTKVFKVF